MSTPKTGGKSGSHHYRLVSSTSSAYGSPDTTPKTLYVFGYRPQPNKPLAGFSPSTRHHASSLNASYVSKLEPWEPLKVRRRRPNFDNYQSRTPRALRRSGLVRHPPSPLSHLCAPEKEAQEIDRMLRDITAVIRYNRRGTTSDISVSTVPLLHSKSCNNSEHANSDFHDSGSVMGGWIRGMFSVLYTGYF